MPEQREIIGQRFKVQYIDNWGEWKDFGPMLSLTLGAIKNRLWEVIMKKSIIEQTGNKGLCRGVEQIWNIGVLILLSFSRGYHQEMMA